MTEQEVVRISRNAVGALLKDEDSFKKFVDTYINRPRNVVVILGEKYGFVIPSKRDDIKYYDKFIDPVDFSKRVYSPAKYATNFRTAIYNYLGIKG